jgi:hypothetical protein
MGISKNPLLKGFSGTIDGMIVVRQYYYEASGETKIVLSAFPDMSNIKPSPDQIACRERFKQVQKQAKEMLADPEIKAFYQERCEGNQRPHNVLISELMKALKTPGTAEAKKH